MKAERTVTCPLCGGRFKAIVYAYRQWLRKRGKRMKDQIVVRVRSLTTKEELS